MRSYSNSFLNSAIGFPNMFPPQGVLLGILGVGVPPRFSNPDPVSEQKVSFSTPVFVSCHIA